MASSAFYYIEANVVCIIVAFILLVRSIKSMDKQLSQLEFQKILVLYIVFFIVDIIWMIFNAKLIKVPVIFLHLVYFFLFLLFAIFSYQWFIYSEVVQHNIKKFSKKARIGWFLPIIILLLFSIHMIFSVFISDKNAEPIIYTYNLHKLMVIVSFSYGVIAGVKTFVRAFKKENYLNKILYIILGFFPFILMAGVIVQMYFLQIPILCFVSTIVVLFYYFYSIDNQILVDPLTKLNNRNQLKKYFHGLQHVSGEYYLLIIDIDDFKTINDKYGHLEGDKALKIVAKTFMDVCMKFEHKSFISRYGGDEFVIIINSSDIVALERLKKLIKKQLFINSEKNNLNYQISVSIGISKIEDDFLENSIANADKALYLEKQKKKKNKILCKAVSN